MFSYNLEHIFSYRGTISPPEVIGPVAEGRRVNFYVTGGKVEGPKVNGELLPVGGDWMTLRTDGVGLVDVRATIKTHDNALIYTAYSGVMDFGKDGYEKLPKGEVPPVVSIHVNSSLLHFPSGILMAQPYSVRGNWAIRYAPFRGGVRYLCDSPVRYVARSNLAKNQQESPSGTEQILQDGVFCPQVNC